MTADPTPPARNARVLEVAVLLGLCWLALTCWQYRRILGRVTPYDDSYITYRYAVNLAKGRGLVFNAGEPVNAASSLLYTLLLATFYRAGRQNLEQAATLVGLVSGFVVIFACTIGVRRRTKRWDLALALLLPLVICCALSGWAISGMETVFYTALVVACFVTYLSEFRGIAMVLMAAAVLTRPEGIIITAAICLAEFIAGNWRRCAVAAMVGGGCFVLYIGINVALYHAPLPHPVLLKTVASYYARSPRAEGLLLAHFISEYFLILFVVAVVSVPLVRRSEPAIVALFAFLAISFISFVLGPFSDMQRYATHAIPLLALAGAVGLGLFADYGRAVVRFVAAVLGIAGCVQAKINQQYTLSVFITGASQQEARKAVGRWIAENVPTRETVLTSDIGAIAYVARSHRFIDAFGLVSREPAFAARDGRWSEFISSLEKRRPAFVADTLSPDGEFNALRDLSEPWTAYRTLPRQPSAMPLPVTASLVFRVSADRSDTSIDIGVAKLDWHH